jgi:murein DD-endopeptidase MepM/ murein hydrolase activator NlpD
MADKVSIGETLFARLFRLVAGKDYLVSVQWDARSPSHFIPLNRSLKNFFLASLGIVVLGLVALAAEVGLWFHREVSLQYHFKQNASLKQDLRGVLADQSRVEATLDSLSRVEEKIRALYGMNANGKALQAFGVGGRRPAADPHLPQGVVSDQVLHSSLKNRQLRSKLDFTHSSFKQIQDYVRYRHNLWEHTPFVLPAKGQVTSGFGYRLHPVTGQHAMHEGLDISNSRWTPIYAPANGMVTTSTPNGNFGNLVAIDHGNGYVTKYGHLTKIMVAKGELVKRYGLIGYMGSTGRATGIHLHYEVHRDGSPQNPEKYILPSGVLVD